VLVPSARVLCRNCVAEINRAAIGKAASVTHIPQHKRRGGDLVSKLNAMNRTARFLQDVAR